MASQKLPQTARTTERKRNDSPHKRERNRDATARFERVYEAASPSARRAIEVALVMLTEGATPELTKTVALKLADMWAGDDAPAAVQR